MRRRSSRACALRSAVERTCPAASASARPISARRRDQGIASRSGSAPARAAADGNRCVTDPTGCSSGSPYASTSRAASVAAPASDTCCPSTARIASSFGSTTPGTRRPGASRTISPISSSAPSASTIGSGSVSRSSSRRHAATAARDRPVLQPEPCLDVIVAGSPGGARRPRPRRAGGRCGGTRRPQPLRRRERRGRRRTARGRDVARRLIGQPELDHASRRPVTAGRSGSSRRGRRRARA